MTDIDVTVVTVTYNAAALVVQCLDSLAAQRLGDVTMRVVVVDNASTDATVELVESHHPDVTVVRSSRNLGFAGGNDLVLASVTTPWVILLNNDAVADPDLVRTLVDEARRSPADVAAVAATVLLAERFRAAPDGTADGVEGPDGTWVADPAGDVRLVNSTGNQVRTDGFGEDRGWLADASRHRPPAEVFGFSGAAALLRTSALRDVGVFDESYFMYYEDTDLSWRMRLAGYRVVHCARAVVSHEHAASSDEGSDFFRFHDARNRLATVTKDASVPLALRTVAAFVVTTASIALRRRQPWHVVRTRLRALASYGRMLPGLLQARRRIGRRAVVPRRDVERLLVAPTTGRTYRR